MTLQKFNATKKELLGSCPIKGNLFSVELQANKYAIVAEKNGNISELLIYSV